MPDFSTMPTGSWTDVIVLMLTFIVHVYLAGDLLFRAVAVRWRAASVLVRSPQVKLTATQAASLLLRRQTLCQSLAIGALLLLVRPERWSLALRPGDFASLKFTLILGSGIALTLISLLVLGPLKNLERYIASVKARGCIDPLPPFALYLRDHAGEVRAREESSFSVQGVGTTHSIPHQVAATRLANVFESIGIPLFGIWDPFGDTRRRLPFAPLLSHEETWRSDVARLASAASLVIIDAEITSTGVAWEIDLILTSSLAKKCLIVESSVDQISSESHRLYSGARWRVTVEGRDTSTGLHERSLQLPVELVEYLRLQVDESNPFHHQHAIDA
jgi:hypothetical protein